MNFLARKRVLVGISGGIAAYKAAELVRLLVRQDAEVRVVMTRGAMAFITPLTLQALSGNPVRHDLLDEQAEAGMGHIELARWADRIVVAPASANFMARLANGMADDLLATLCLASEAPILLAPAMNRLMWENPRTRENAGKLENSGIRILGPASGDQACGETGPGRMLEPDQILAAISNSFRNHLLAGLRVMITAGPTREAIDSVRYISNRSSGKMGFALARAAREAGADVTLVCGPVELDTPDGVTRIDVQTARQMGQTVMDQVTGQHILIGAAAVADYTPTEVHQGKMKKSPDSLTLALSPTMDIMSSVGELPTRPFTVGFAAETDNLLNHARDKRERKHMDMIAANLVNEAGTGFEADDNELMVIWADGQQKLEMDSKDRVARRLIELISRQFNIGDQATH